MLQRLVYIFLFFLLATRLLAQPSEKKLTPDDYISRYKEDAIKEMYQYGIPASITLAQGMLESGNGNSALSVYANNHFGIKCHKEWNGPTYILDDDEKNECFRKYQDVLDSYSDHSKFLSTRDRYAFLFELPKTDYKGWAKGLKRAGYATNPEYAFKLIDLIEKYKLNLLDQGRDLPVCKDASEPVAHVRHKAERTEMNQDRNLFYRAPTLAPEGFINEVPYIISKKGDTYFSVSKEKEMMLWQVLKYNDADKNDVLREGEIVYLKPKRLYAKEDFHIVKQGESLRSISQLYGIKLNRLYLHNNMSPGQEAMAGQKINLK